MRLQNHPFRKALKGLPITICLSLIGKTIKSRIRTFISPPQDHHDHRTTRKWPFHPSDRKSAICGVIRDLWFIHISFIYHSAIQWDLFKFHDSLIGSSLSMTWSCRSSGSGSSHVLVWGWGNRWTCGFVWKYCPQMAISMGNIDQLAEIAWIFVWIFGLP